MKSVLSVQAKLDDAKTKLSSTRDERRHLYREEEAATALASRNVVQQYSRIRANTRRRQWICLLVTICSELKRVNPISGLRRPLQLLVIRLRDNNHQSHFKLIVHNRMQIVLLQVVFACVVIYLTERTDYGCFLAVSYSISLSGLASSD